MTSAAADAAISRSNGGVRTTASARSRSMGLEFGEPKTSMSTCLSGVLNWPAESWPGGSAPASPASRDRGCPTGRCNARRCSLPGALVGCRGAVILDGVREVRAADRLRRCIDFVAMKQIDWNASRGADPKAAHLSANCQAPNRCRARRRASVTWANSEHGVGAVIPKAHPRGWRSRLVEHRRRSRNACRAHSPRVRSHREPPPGSPWAIRRRASEWRSGPNCRCRPCRRP